MRGVVLAYEVNNGPSPDELVARLREAEAGVRAQLNADAIAEHPQIQAWREAFRAFGAKPSEFRSSIEAMARRALRNDPLPSINALVDIGNILSLRHLLPMGVHAIDHLTQDLALRPATGAEDFVPFGSEQLEHPLPGEIVFVEGNIVLTRRWVWRQSNATITVPESRAVEYNIDALPPVTLSKVEEVCRETAVLVQQFCGGRTRSEILSRENPSLRLTE